MDIVETKYYSSVDALSSSTDEYIVPNGKTFYMYACGGNACYSNNVKVEIFFDTTLIFSTHGDGRIDIETLCVGDGFKKVKIKITNDSLAAETCGGWYSGSLG